MKKKYRVSRAEYAFGGEEYFYVEYKYPFIPFWFQFSVYEKGKRCWNWNDPVDAEAACVRHANQGPSEYPKELGWLP